jgi:hypothetical protein
MNFVIVTSTKQDLYTVYMNTAYCVIQLDLVRII